MKPRIFASFKRFGDFIDSCSNDYSALDMSGVFVYGFINYLKLNKKDGAKVTFQIFKVGSFGIPYPIGECEFINGFIRDEFGMLVSHKEMNIIHLQNTPSSASAADQ